MKEKFIEFLKEKKAYRNFVFNLSERRNKTLAQYLAETDEACYISRAFPWSFSPEKKEYWNTLDDEWQEVINPHKTETPGNTLKDELESIVNDMIMMAERIRKLTSNKAIGWPEVDDDAD